MQLICDIVYFSLNLPSCNICGRFTVRSVSANVESTDSNLALWFPQQEDSELESNKKAIFLTEECGRVQRETNGSKDEESCISMITGSVLDLQNVATHGTQANEGDASTSVKLDSVTVQSEVSKESWESKAGAEKCVTTNEIRAASTEPANTANNSAPMLHTDNVDNTKVQSQGTDFPNASDSKDSDLESSLPALTEVVCKANVVERRVVDVRADSSAAEKGLLGRCGKANETFIVHEKQTSGDAKFGNTSESKAEKACTEESKSNRNSFFVNSAENRHVGTEPAVNTVKAILSTAVPAEGMTNEHHLESNKGPDLPAVINELVVQYRVDIGTDLASQQELTDSQLSNETQHGVTETTMVSDKNKCISLISPSVKTQLTANAEKSNIKEKENANEQQPEGLRQLCLKTALMSNYNNQSLTLQSAVKVGLQTKEDCCLDTDKADVINHEQPHKFFSPLVFGGPETDIMSELKQSHLSMLLNKAADEHSDLDSKRTDQIQQIDAVPLDKSNCNQLEHEVKQRSNEPVFKPRQPNAILSPKKLQTKPLQSPSPQQSPESPTKVNSELS